MSSAASALRIRLEGQLEVIEAGIERYHKAMSLERGALEELLAHEDELGLAADKVVRLPDADPVLRALLRERRSLRKKLKRRLRSQGVDEVQLTLAEEVKVVLARDLPAPRTAPAGRYIVRPSYGPALVIAAVTIGLGLFAFHPLVALVYWLVFGGLGLADAAQLDIYADRIRLSRRFFPVREVPLAFAKPKVASSSLETAIGRIALRSDYDAKEAMTLLELLRFPDFANVGELRDEGIWETNDGVALVSEETAVLIPNGPEPYDAAVAQHYDWTAPRAWLLAHVIARLSPYDRRRIVMRLTVSGGATMTTREQLGYGPLR